MKILYTFLCFFLMTAASFAQDVIVKKTGEMINGKVLEVGVEFLKYKRGDQTDGPVYTMPLKYVYAVSYADRTQDIFTTPDSTILKEFLAKEDTTEQVSFWESERSQVAFGLGLLKSYTKIDDNSGKNSIQVPLVFGGYAIEMKKDLMLGVEFVYSSYKTSGNVNDQYDEFVSDYTIQESIMSFNAYVKKNFTLNSHIFPYVKVGVGFNNSQIDLNSSLDLDQRGRRSLIIQSAGNVTGLNIIGRIGMEYYFNPKFGVFLDAGTGQSNIQFGMITTLSSPFKKKKKTE